MSSRDLRPTDHTTHDLQDWGRQFPEDHLNKAKDATVLKRFASLDVRMNYFLQKAICKAGQLLTTISRLVPYSMHRFRLLECRLSILKLTIDV